MVGTNDIRGEDAEEIDVEATSRGGRVSMATWSLHARAPPPVTGCAKTSPVT
jgi:hypothetical protein